VCYASMHASAGSAVFAKRCSALRRLPPVAPNAIEIHAFTRLRRRTMPDRQNHGVATAVACLFMSSVTYRAQPIVRMSTGPRDPIGSAGI